MIFVSSVGGKNNFIGQLWEFKQITMPNYRENQYEVKKILLIDDDDIQCWMSQKLINSVFPNYKVFIEHNGTTGLEATYKIKPDLIILNINMPIKNGWEYMDDLRKNIRIPIVVLSSSIFSQDPSRLKQYEGRILEYISKPLTIDTVRTIPKFIDKYKRETANSEYKIGLAFIDNRIRTIKLYDNGKIQIYNQGSEEIDDDFSEFIESNEAIEEFEYLINSSQTKEVNIQKFFERNPDFILNDDYEAAHSKIMLEPSAGTIFIPDFVLEPYEKNAFCDILELKLPNAKLYTIKKNRIRYSSAILEVCAQLREYSNYFESESNRDKVHVKYNLKVYKPQMIVIIGRNTDVIDPEIIRRIQLDLPNLKVQTYDDVLSKMKRKLSWVTRKLLR